MTAAPVGLEPPPGCGSDPALPGVLSPGFAELLGGDEGLGVGFRTGGAPGTKGLRAVALPVAATLIPWRNAPA